MADNGFVILEHPVQKDWSSDKKSAQGIDIMSDTKSTVDLLDVKVETTQDFKDDPILRKVHEKVNEMRLAAPDSKVPGSDVVGVTKPVVSNKKVKITQQMIEDAYSRLRVLVAGERVSAASITVLVAYAMQLSDELLDTDKKYKIELALAILRKLIDEEVTGVTERATLHMMVETVVPTLIGTLTKLPSLLQKLCCCGKKQ